FAHTLIALNLFDHLLLVFDHAGGPADPKVVRQDPPEECLPVFLDLSDLLFVLGVKGVLIQLFQLLREWFHLCLPSQDFGYVSGSCLPNAILSRRDGPLQPWVKSNEQTGCP